MSQLLRIAIPVLALVDGAIHLSLVLLLRRPGAGIQPFSYFQGRFLANFLAYLVLAIAFLLVQNRTRVARQMVDGLLIVLAAATLIAWAASGSFPNPMGWMGFTSKAIEVIIIVAVALHLTKYAEGFAPMPLAASR